MCLFQLLRVDGSGEITQFERVNPAAVFRNLKMQVGTGGIAGGTGDAQHISLIHMLAHAHQPLAHMCIQRRVSASVGDHNVIAVRLMTVPDFAA